MDKTTKGAIAVLLSLIVLAVAVYGSYLPMRKSQIYIRTLQDLQSNPPASLAELKDRVAAPLDYPSPIGQEELVRNTANSIIGLVQQQGVDAASIADILQFLQKYYDPITARGKGMSFGQDLYILGAINETAFTRTGETRYIKAAQAYFEKAHELGPDRPQALYGLFDVYRALADTTSTVRTADLILSNWPTDTVIRPALEQFLASRKGGASPKTAPAGK